MKTYLPISLILLIVYSCAMNKPLQNIEGEYATREKKFNHYIEISNDSTFVYSTGFLGSLISKCSGKWKLNNKKDTIELLCEEKDPLETLTSTYMEKRINKFKILNKKLINGKLILHKQWGHVYSVPNK